MEHDDYNIYNLEENEILFLMHNRGYCSGSEECPYCEVRFWFDTTTASGSYYTPEGCEPI